MEILRHFCNPLLILLMRVGLVKAPLFLYRISANGCRYEMLARPASLSMTDLFVLREVLVEETYAEVLPLLPAGPVRSVDIGGNLGSFTVWLHQRHGLREGYCFEPEPTSFNLCRFNLAHNGCAAVTPFPQAVGGRARQIEMCINPERPGGHNIYRQSRAPEQQTRPMEVVAFAEWMKEKAGAFDVLKIDCEGAEWEMLDETPPETFQQFYIIIAEIHDDPGGRHKLDDFPATMKRHGFETLRWDGHAMGLYLGRRTTPGRQ